MPLAGMCKSKLYLIENNKGGEVQQASDLPSPAVLESIEADGIMGWLLKEGREDTGQEIR